MIEMEKSLFIPAVGFLGAILVFRTTHWRDYAEKSKSPITTAISQIWTHFAVALCILSIGLVVFTGSSKIDNIPLGLLSVILVIAFIDVILGPVLVLFCKTIFGKSLDKPILSNFEKYIKHVVIAELLSLVAVSIIVPRAFAGEHWKILWQLVIPALALISLFVFILIDRQNKKTKTKRVEPVPEQEGGNVMSKWSELSILTKLEFAARLIRWPFGLVVGSVFVSKNIGSFKNPLVEWIFIIFGVIWIIAGAYVDWRGAASLVMTDAEQKRTLKFPKIVYIEISISILALMFLANVSLEPSWFSVTTVWRIVIGLFSFLVIMGAFILAYLAMKGRNVKMK